MTAYVMLLMPVYEGDIDGQFTLGFAFIGLVGCIFAFGAGSMLLSSIMKLKLNF